MVSSLRPSRGPHQLVLHADTVGRGLMSVSAVRRAVGHFLDREGVASARHDVLLVVSELVTNALMHTDNAPAVTVRHESEPERVDIEVFDGSCVMPMPRTPGATAIGGRGLRIVEQVASAWGVRPNDHGKTMWATVAVKAPAQV